MSGGMGKGMAHVVSNGLRDRISRVEPSIFGPKARSWLLVVRASNISHEQRRPQLEILSRHFNIQD